MTKSPTYLGKKPCSKGHHNGNGQCLRYVSNSGCVECQKMLSLRIKIGRDEKYVQQIIANRKDALAKKQRTFLGGLCGRGHDYDGTGFSLKSTATRNCIECKKLTEKSRKKTDKRAETDSIDDRFFLGMLCRRGHDYGGTGFSLRRVCNKCCVECSKASAIEYEKTRPPRKHSSYEMEIPPVPKPVDHRAMTEDYKSRIAAIKRLEYQMRKEMAI